MDRRWSRVRTHRAIGCEVSAVKRSLRDSVVRLGLAGPALESISLLARLDPRTAVGNARIRRKGAPDGLPIPPARLVFAVAGTADVSWFLRGGELAAASITELLDRHLVDVSKLSKILDFGAGCGRVVRYWSGLTQTRVHATDNNAALVDWCRNNLRFVQADVNRLEPPLQYADGQFDLVYALSVFTHLTESLQLAWIAELGRVLKPAGHLVLSLHGDAYRARLNAEELRRFDSGRLVVKNDTKAPGTNACAAYHPVAYVRETLTSGLALVDFIAEGARGNPRQDLYLLRKGL
jgi:SAM-dependent methyltransferase